MAANVAELGIDRMTVAERLELIEQNWNSLPEQVEASDVAPWHLAELAKRRAAAKAKPGIGKPWREVLDQIETKP